MNLDDRLYTSTEVAEILGVSLRSVYRYLEENKLDAEVKTATGRHRFTKKNILDFLYPNKDNTVPPREAKAPVRAPIREPEPVVEEKVEEPVVEPVHEPEEEVKVEEPVVEAEEEEVDWLAKFRAAAEKHRIESQEGGARESLSSLANEEPMSEPEPEKQDEQTEYFYKSSVGGLKELAQQINKTARQSNVPYAFTMNAGLSLHKMIRPFSILHIYAKPEDREYFERTLELTEATEGNAQMGIFVDTGRVIENRKEIHGLYVVSDLQLRKDLLEHGEVDLASEFDEVADF